MIPGRAREYNREGGRGERGSLLPLPVAIVILVLLELPTKGHFEVSSQSAEAGMAARFRGSSLSIRATVFFAPRLGSWYDRRHCYNF